MSSANPQYATLTANTVKTVDFSGLDMPGGATVKVTTDGSASQRIYFTADGTTPTVDGDNCWCLLGGQAGWKAITLKASGATKAVKLISAGTPWVSIEVYPSFGS